MIYLFIWLFIGLMCGAIAQSKGRNGFGWAIIGLLFSLLGLLAVALVSENKQAPKANCRRPAPSNRLANYDKLTNSYNWPE